MLQELKTLVNRKMVEKELKKYGLELKHYVRGRIRIGIQKWNGNEDTLQRLISDLQADPDIFSITYTKETKSVVIFYNHEAVRTEKTKRNWYAIYKKYTYFQKR